MNVSKILQKYLTAEWFGDHKAFGANKTRLIVQTRVKNGKISSLSERLRAVQDL